ncbi:MAG: ATP-binding protein, partial [Candidatus Thermoplasmatota archaeon]|nr:ATP-binding protein [Candidatus Thermoplasmatota archaeon]
MTGPQLEGLNHHILTLKGGYESDILEYKRNFNSKEVLITTSAFANTRGGTIIIGIDDSGGVKGVKLGNESLRDWANQISQGTEPVVAPEIILETIQGKPVVLVKIAESPIKPVS